MTIVDLILAAGVIAVLGMAVLIAQYHLTKDQE